MMVPYATLVLALAATSVTGAPLSKRIAQVISASTAKWEQACLAAGGAQKCNPVSITAFTTLLAAAGPCEQQDAADQMIDLAKSLNNDTQMIKLTQIFAQQPRNTPNSVAVPYCQKAPKNAELNGLFQCQYQGANQQTFVGGASVGQAGTIPFGRNQPLNPLGSCVAHPQGPIADGSQLVDITQDPGVGNVQTGSQNNSGKKGKSSGNSSSGSAKSPPAATPAAASSSSAAGSSSSGGFKLQNGKDAQALNAKFASLSASSSCTDGDNACVNGAFAQCVGGKFVTTPCAGSLTCVALPLVNKPGTSVTCSTTADAEARIAATGATGGISGSGSASSSSSSNSSGSTNKADAPSNNSNAATNAAPSSASSGGGFKLQNGKDAQALNAKFATLSASSSCKDGDNACINGAFAQCVGGKFTTTPCAGGLTCVALPLVNKPGTSVTCSTTADAQARIAATGTTGGITGA